MRRANSTGQAGRARRECASRGAACTARPGASGPGLSKSFGKGEGLVRAVDEVDLEVRVAETIAVMGPSGCGKSTLLHLLGGLERPSGGEVLLAGSRLDQMGERALARLRRTAVGFVFQAFHLRDELTARENVELPALLAAGGAQARRGTAGAGRARGPGRVPACGAVRGPAPAGGGRPGP
ncbi:MAG: ATP-binding cassette domain-containing protein [Streptosporangiaceae bacterium]